MQEEVTSRDNYRISVSFFAALLLSLLAHSAFLFFASRFEPPNFGEKFYEQLVPRKFRVERVEIDPKLLEEERSEISEVPLPRAEIALPPEQITPEIALSPAAQPSKLDPTQIAPEPIKPTTDILSSAEIKTALPSNDLARELEKIREELLEKESSSAQRPVLPIQEKLKEASAGTGAVSMRIGNVAGYSELDELLQRTGPLSKGTAPIFMPGDVLFDYDSADLRPEAIESLTKLGTIMLRNPDVLFRIEGHTDSFGTPEYNFGLSLRRAEAVKDWLVRQMGISPEKIETRGFGSTRLIAPATGSIEEQQVNRRVEIALEFPN